MRRMFLNVLCGAALLTSMNMGRAHATTIVSNLNDAVGGQGSIYVSGPPQYYAQEFAAGNQSAQLGSIIAALGDARGSFIPSAELVNNNSGQPGTSVLTTFSFPTLPASGFSDLTFLPNSTVLLSANTDYWFLLSASPTATSGSSDRYQWQYTSVNDPLLPLYASTHDGVSWEVESSGPFLIAVNSIVPEPSSLFLLGVAAVVAGSLRLKRAKTLFRM